jgi:hypothetical protein
MTIDVISSGAGNGGGVGAAAGWFENPDQQSLFWDLRWSVKARDVDQTRLHPGQIVNHFARVACCITTKAGLLSNLTAESRWFVHSLSQSLSLFSTVRMWLIPHFPRPLAWRYLLGHRLALRGRAASDLGGLEYI